MDSASSSSLTKADLPAVTPECPNCQQQRPSLSPRCGTVPQEDEVASGDRLIALDSICLARGTCS